MIVNLSSILTDKFGNYEQPFLMITTLDDRPICPVINPLTMENNFTFNDISDLTFSVADRMLVDGEWIDNPCFDELIGMRKIIMEPFGAFLISNPEIIDDGETRVKEVKCYSGEHQLTHKLMPVLEGTFRLHDPTGMDKDTMMNIILECCPDWKVGTISSGVCNRYRTFDMTSQSVYSFLMGDFQTSYGVIVLFDTLKKEINIYDVNDDVDTVEVYLDKYNLIKENQIQELSDEIVTCLSVYGADDVSIASVNPVGQKIYNLDYMIKVGDIPEDVAAAWDSWKLKFDIYQKIFSDLYAQMYNDQLRYNSNYVALVDLHGEYSSMEAVLDTYNTSTANHEPEKSELIAQMAAKQVEIDAQQAIVDTIHAQLESDQEMLQEIAVLCSFEHNFTEEQLRLLNLYMKEDSLQDSSFVLSNVVDQPTALAAPSNSNIYTVSITAGDLYRADDYVDLTDEEWASLDLTAEEKAELQTITDSLSESYLGHHFFQINSGICDISSADGTFSLFGSLTNSTLSYSETANDDGSYDALITLSLSEPSVGGDEISYSNALFVASGKIRNFNYSADIESENTDTMQFEIIGGVLTLTCDSSIDMRQNTLQELYEYGKTALESLAWPSYEFSIDVANLYGIEEFEYFRQQLALGKKCYVEMGPDYYLRPILIGAEVDWMDITKLVLTFSSKFSSNSPEFLLSQTIGKTAHTAASLDASKFNYNAYINSGIENEVEELITGALDIAKKNVINSANQDILMNAQGIHLRKYDPITGLFDPGEVRLMNNQIVFTNDSWQTASLAIGKIETPDGASTMGIVGQSLIGEVLIGNKLLIEATNPDANFGGNVTHFRVDAGGVKMANGAIYIQGSDPHNQIIIDPQLGIMAGDSSLFTLGESGFELDIYDDFGKMIYDETLYKDYGLEIPAGAAFFFDINTGNLVFRGDIYANNGYFKGTVNADAGYFKGTINVNDKFIVDKDGNVTADGNLKATNADITGKITAETLDCTNATVVGLEVGNNVTMGPNAVISWEQIYDADELATLDDIPSDSYITTLTQNAIKTGSMYLSGNVYFKGTEDYSNGNYIALGVNGYGNLQVGSPSPTAQATYDDTNVYAPNNIYLVPGGQTVSSDTEDSTGWTVCIRNNSNGRGLSVHGTVSSDTAMYVSGDRVLTTADVGDLDSTAVFG